jgi:hypothetical protein
VYTVFDGGSPGNAESAREIVCQPFQDDGVAAERKMGTMLLGGTDGDEQRRTLQQSLTNRTRGHLL